MSFIDSLSNAANVLWSIVEHWSLLICIVGVFGLTYASWTRDVKHCITFGAMLIIGVLGAFV